MMAVFANLGKLDARAELFYGGFVDFEGENKPAMRKTCLDMFIK